MIIEQIRSNDGTGTLSYFLKDDASSVAVIVDPNIEDLQEFAAIVQQTHARVTHIVDTHTHADHISGAGELKKMFGARIVMHKNTKNKWKIVDEGDRFGIGDTLRANARIPIDWYVDDGEVIATGNLSIQIMFTPGHTDNHLTLLTDEAVFTGDLLLIGQAGRSDLPGGNPAEQYESLFKKIIPLPDHLRMYPGHDYAGNEYSLLGDEKKRNPFLQHRTKEEYIVFVKDFFPPIAEMVLSGSKMTLQCGTQRVVQTQDNIKSITPRELEELMEGPQKPLILDVREPMELVMIGAIDGVVNIPVGQLASRLVELPRDENAPIVCVCQSGNRSLEATHFLQQNGYVNVKNLAGGTGAWIKSGFKVVRPKDPVS